MSITEKIDIFFSKHRRLSLIIFPALISILITFPLLSIKEYLLFSILFGFFVLFFVLFVTVAPTRLEIKGVQELAKGDPYPLLDITKTLLSFDLSESHKQNAIMNHSEGLRHIGKYEEAYSMMINMNIDKIPNPTDIKIIYYGNLSDICSLLGKYDEAVFYYKKVMTLFSDMKEGFAKRNLQKRQFLLFLNIQNAFINKRFDEAINLSVLFLNDQEVQKNIASITDASLICALAHYQKSEFEFAKNYLYGIIQNGNKLYAVKEAENLLKIIESR